MRESYHLDFWFGKYKIPVPELEFICKNGSKAFWQTKLSSSENLKVAILVFIFNISYHVEDITKKNNTFKKKLLFAFFNLLFAMGFWYLNSCYMLDAQKHIKKKIRL